MDDTDHMISMVEAATKLTKMFNEINRMEGLDNGQKFGTMCLRLGLSPEAVISGMEITAPVGSIPDEARPRLFLSVVFGALYQRFLDMPYTEIPPPGAALQ